MPTAQSFSFASAPLLSDLPPSIPHAVFRAAERYGDDPAIVDDLERTSFRTIAAETRRAAKAFMAMGLAKGDVVGVWGPNVWRWAAAAAGCQAAGGVVPPLNTRMRGREVTLVAARADMKALVTAGRFLGLPHHARRTGHCKRAEDRCSRRSQRSG